MFRSPHGRLLDGSIPPDDPVQASAQKAALPGAVYKAPLKSKVACVSYPAGDHLSARTQTHSSGSSRTATPVTHSPPAMRSRYPAVHPLTPFTFQSREHLHKPASAHVAGAPGSLATHPLVSRPPRADMA